MEDSTENELKQPSEIEKLSKDYADYLHIDASKERQAFNDSIEEMLTKLDEFGGLVDMIRSDTNICVNEAVPRLQAKCEDMKKIFTRIDQLEVFVGIVKQDVSMMEELVVKAEQDLGSFSVKNFFSSLLAPKKASQGKENKPTYEPPEIFVTEQYLTPVIHVKKVPQESAQESEKTGESEEHDIVVPEQNVTESEKKDDVDEETKDGKSDS